MLKVLVTTALKVTIWSITIEMRGTTIPTVSALKLTEEPSAILVGAHSSNCTQEIEPIVGVGVLWNIIVGIGTDTQISHKRFPMVPGQDKQPIHSTCTYPTDWICGGKQTFQNPVSQPVASELKQRVQCFRWFHYQCHTTECDIVSRGQTMYIYIYMQDPTDYTRLSVKSVPWEGVIHSHHIYMDLVAFCQRDTVTNSGMGGRQHPWHICGQSPQYGASHQVGVDGYRFLWPSPTLTNRIYCCIQSVSFVSFASRATEGGTEGGKGGGGGG